MESEYISMLVKQKKAIVFCHTEQTASRTGLLCGPADD